MIAAVQNVRILIRHGDQPPPAVAQELHRQEIACIWGLHAVLSALNSPLQSIKSSIKRFLFRDNLDLNVSGKGVVLWR